MVLGDPGGPTCGHKGLRRGNRRVEVEMEDGSRVRERTEGHSAGLEGEEGAGGTSGSWRGQGMDLPLEPTEGAAL